MNPTPLFLAALLLWAGALPAHGQPMVVADSACLKHEIDVASFATCDGDRMARPPVARITAVDAYQLKEQGGSMVLLLDVRDAIALRETGAAASVDALVPLMLRDPGALDEGDANPAFVATVRQLVATRFGVPAPPVLLLCADGQLAQAAAVLLQQVGLTQLWGIEGGVEGRLADNGVREGGRKAVQLPWVTRLGGRVGAAG